MALAQQGAGFRGDFSYTFEFYRRVAWPIRMMIQVSTYLNEVYGTSLKIIISFSNVQNPHGPSLGNLTCQRAY